MPAMEKNMAGNLFLVGLMGAGKTTLGKQLAEHLNRPFYDSDHVICERTGVSIPTIFEMEGEQGFRDRESTVLADLAALDNIVLATGGGAVLRENNRACLRDKGTVIYLHVLPEILFERTRYDKNRPLLQVADPLAKFKELYEIRHPIYRETAHIVLEVGKLGCQTTLNKILEMIEEL
ncbi:Shikimate kinase 1 [Kingella kingae]|nr:shikimate kinase [Kingella kingae]MBD3631877.1 shikimate kinase [Kingella kingae]MBD3659196.1 shikimate kinase [Kingella kingae]CRZ20283.1 shikimate kinase I [Kingella kingae]STR03648.1 Shikimate kinase 1 [Kingella kingae]